MLRFREYNQTNYEFLESLVSHAALLCTSIYGQIWCEFWCLKLELLKWISSHFSESFNWCLFISFHFRKDNTYQHRLDLYRVNAHCPLFTSLSMFYKHVYRQFKVCFQNLPQNYHNGWCLPIWSNNSSLS